jgi:hypothetical protein
MNENQKKILEMLAQGKINVEEASRLLYLVNTREGGQERTEKVEPDTRVKAKYLRVTVTPGEENGSHDGRGERVNVRVPMSLIRAGIKLTALVPPDALDKANRALREKGINFDVRSIKPDDIEELIEALGDMTVDIEGGRGEKVKVFVE